MRRLRFRLAGYLLNCALLVMPSGVIRETFIDAIADWRDEIELEAELANQK